MLETPDLRQSKQATIGCMPTPAVGFFSSFLSSFVTDVNRRLLWRGEREEDGGDEGEEEGEAGGTAASTIGAADGGEGEGDAVLLLGETEQGDVEEVGEVQADSR